MFTFFNTHTLPSTFSFEGPWIITPNVFQKRFLNVLLNLRSS